MIKIKIINQAKELLQRQITNEDTLKFILEAIDEKISCTPISQNPRLESDGMDDLDL